MKVALKYFAYTERNYHDAQGMHSLMAHVTIPQTLRLKGLSSFFLATAVAVSVQHTLPWPPNNVLLSTNQGV